MLYAVFFIVVVRCLYEGTRWYPPVPSPQVTNLCRTQEKYQAPGQDIVQEGLHLLLAAELKEVRAQAAERFLTYVYIKNSSPANTRLKDELKNDFAKGHDKYPQNRQEGLRLLDMITKQVTHKPTVISEGSSFGTVSGGQDSKDYDKEYWKNKTCRCCGKKGHPGWIHTPEEQAKSRKAQQEKNEKESKKESKGSDEESVGSTRRKKSSRSTATTKKANLDEAAKAFATAMAENMGTIHEWDDSYDYGDNDNSH
jgi:hypothetical protein